MILGITGGIASGKTTTTGELARIGIPTISADAIAKELLKPGSEISRQVIRELGDRAAVIGKADTVDREALGKLIFTNSEVRKRLEAITHPPIIRELRSWIAANRMKKTPLAAAEIPLLFEANMEGDVDIVLVVECTEETQCSRLMARVPGLSRPDALQRIRTQLPIQEKSARADYRISSESPLELMLAETRNLAETLQVSSR